MVGDDVLQAVARLAVDPDFRVFMDEIRRRREAARDGLEAANDPWMAGRYQGESIACGGLVDLVNDARGALTKRQAGSR